ncbi:hypothetical protein ElyMa_003976100 [Elysia marginata]|uniref:Uncharacterized protein n=1 Tax=Elysia marginata TaxID=1093978 RepID=A0AAV4FWR0_9GAST|nr:hypothetical protein ElyMa_003976100 [Elysia marginata]
MKLTVIHKWKEVKWASLRNNFQEMFHTNISSGLKKNLWVFKVCSVRGTPQGHTRARRNERHTSLTFLTSGRTSSDEAGVTYVTPGAAI